MKRILCLCSLICLVIFSGTVFAKQEIIEASGSYTMDTLLDETFADATARAREEAKRAATEQAGVYLQSYSKMVNLKLDYDEVRTVAAQLLKIQDEKRNTEIVEENLIKITVTVKALVDDNNDAVLKAMMQDKQDLEESTRQYSQLQKEYDDLKRQMEELKRQYSSASAEQKIELKKAAAQNAQKFNAAQEWEAGNDFYRRGEYQNALDAYNRAASLNPDLPEIYNNRGNTYAALGKYQDALNDLQTAVKALANNAKVHNNLGSAYLSLKNFDAAVSEYTQAIRLNSQFAEAYYNRALAYSYLGRYTEALPDAKKALDLNPDDADSQKLYSQISGRLGR